jgi:hypothetical protein
MMRDLQLTDELDSLLSAYHHWAKGYIPVPVCGADPMFRNAKSGRGYDSVSDVIEDELHGSTMECIDFHIGEIQEPYRAALYILARNCYTGHKVWLSPRLPKDPIERGTIILEARNQLTRRLMAAGVM